jgi:serine/threonine protein kinase
MEILRALPPHENVIRLRYYAAEPIPEEEDSRLLRLFMDFLPSNLHKVIKGYPTGLPIPLIQVYGRQLFSGLAHLAQRNIVHRDLLPRNILIDPSTQTLKLADFGCAKVVTPDIPNHPQVGAWQYRAVELLLGATLYDSKAGTPFNLKLITDVWSASVIILEMISGKYPFAVTSEDNMVEGIVTVMGPITMEQVRDAGVDPLEFPQLLAGSASNSRRWSDVQLFPQTPSPELRSLLNLALEYSPRRRHDAAGLLEHDFFKSSIQ